MEPQAISSDLIRGHIDTIILYSLTDGDKFAQQISDTIEEKSEKEYKINQATLYSSLKRLETLKHVNSYWNDSPNGRRKYFRLTDLGKQAVETNLSNWSYSRAIIDKLMDCSPEPIYQTKVVEVEKVVEKIVEVEVPVVREVEVPIQVQQVETVKVEPVQAVAQPAINSPVQQVYTPVQPVIQPTQQKVERQESPQEVNFRSILSGLVKASLVNTNLLSTTEEVIEEEKVESSTVEKQEKLQPIAIEKPKFNETLTAINYNPNKSIHTGKIDFGDLMLKASKEGYKLRVSSKESYVQVGNLFSRKLKLISSIMIFIISLLEFMFLTTNYNSVVSLNNTQKIVVCCALAVFPIVMFILYVAKPSFASAKKIHVDSVLTTAIIVFNLLLITLSANLLANVDFSNLDIIVYSALIPCVLYIDVLLYFVIRFLISKLPVFYTKVKKTA